MGKKGAGLIVIVFILILFILFIALKTGGYIKTTGFVINQGSFVKNVSLVKIEVLGIESFNITDTVSFYKGDNIACIIQYQPGPKEKVDVGFYSSDKDAANPNKIFSDIFNDSLDNTVCQDEIAACLVYYNVTDYLLGNWNCFARNGGVDKISNKLEMKNKPPILIKDILPFNLNANGTPLDLKEYFVDEEGDKITYGAVGQLHILVLVDSKGLVTFTNPSKWEGYEDILFRAHDGISGSFSNSVKIKVGNADNPAVSGCIPIWDCSWGSCVNGQQVCTYYDKNKCNIQIGKPVNLIKSCSVTTKTDTSQPKIIAGNLKNFNGEISSVNGTSRILLYVGLVILVLLIMVFGTLTVLSFRKKPLVVNNNQVVNANVVNTQKFQATSNLNQLQNYINEALKSGQQEKEIVQGLLKAGWEKKDIDDALNYVKLKNFVDLKLAGGFSKEKIIESLKAKGWKDDLINSLFK